MQDLSIQALQDIIHRIWCCMFICHPDGTIVWSNAEFINWSGFTEAELTRKKWYDLVIFSDTTKDDINAVNALDERKPSYQTRIHFKQKHAEPVLGILRIERWPHYGDTQFLWAVLMPVKDQSAEALNYAMEAIAKQIEVTEKQVLEMEKLKLEMQLFTSRSEEEDWIIKTLRIARKHSRITLTVLIIIMTGVGSTSVNSVIAMLQRVGMIPVPAIEANDSNLFGNR